MNSTSQPDDSAPPPVRRSRLRPLALIGSALSVAAVLLLVVVNIERPGGERGVEPLADGAIDLIDPGALEKSERAFGESGYGQIVGVEAQTGWIESVDPVSGRLAQRHRFERLDPNPQDLPEGWLRMLGPQAEIYQSGGRMLRLSGRSALVRAPHRVLEHGTLSGDVRIEVFDGPDPAKAGAVREGPVLVVRTGEASFDNKLGEVRCDGPVIVEAPGRLTMPGSDLTVRIDDLRDVYVARMARGEYVLVEGREDGTEARHEAGRHEGGRHEGTEARRHEGTGDGGTESRSGEETEREAAFYRLTLHENVLVRQRAEGGERTVRGDRLSVVFSERSQGFEGGFAAMLPARPPQAAAPMSLAAALAALSLACPRGDAAPDLAVGQTMITWDGPLTIEPLPEGEKRPQDSRDMVLSVWGGPLRLDDGSTASSATGSVLSYSQLEQRLELAGGDDEPVRVNSPELTAHGRRFWMSRVSHLGGLEGSGGLTFTPQDDGAPTPPADGTDAQRDPVAELNIQWSRGVDLEFFDDTDGSRLRSATFDGEVRVRHAEIHMDAERMIVGFGRGASEQTIESIGARGAVVVTSVGDSGRMRCEHLDLALATAEDGQTHPTRLQAFGGVEAVQDRQVIWSDTLEVSFVRGPAADTPETPPSPGRRFAARVHELKAAGDVQVLLADGSRAFGDELLADAPKESAVLRGEDVVVVHDKALFDHGSRGVRLEIDKSSGRAYWVGAGQLRVFTAPIVTEGEGRIERPRIDNDAVPPQVNARWNDSMRIDATMNDGAGAVDLEGAVEAVTRLAPAERNTMEGQVLTLHFAFAPGGGAAPAAERAPAAALDDRERVLKKLIAKGKARLENRTWSGPDRQGKPRVFHVSGEHVEYDDLAVEATVLGEGMLLIRDEEPLGPVDPPSAAPADPERPFSGKGITQFQFGEKLFMARVGEGRYDFLLSGNVGVAHKSIDGRTATLTGSRLEVSVQEQRPEGAAEHLPPAREATGLQLGGRLELRRIHALGAVMVKTPTREVECDDLDYNLASGIARLAARPGRRVSVLTHDTDFPIRAASMTWDLVSDTIRVTDAAGTGGR